jgi:alpha-tubulin suppressor-like RCC1 family protein
VPGLSGVISLSGSSAGTYCAVLSTGEIKCWGKNEQGQLGAGLTTGPDACCPLSDAGADIGCFCSKTPISVVGIHDAVSVAVGEAHSCALLSDGTVMCWGFGGFGGLGRGTFDPSPVPVPIQW